MFGGDDDGGGDDNDDDDDDDDDGGGGGDDDDDDDDGDGVSDVKKWSIHNKLQLNENQTDLRSIQIR